MNIQSDGLTKGIFAITISMNKYSFNKEDGKMPKSPERCQEIREEARSKILHDSMLYFARNGFAGTKISDLAKHIGIGQGTLYVYFKSKEELFNEIYALTNYSEDIKELNILAHLPISAKKKIRKLSKSIMTNFQQDETMGWAKRKSATVRIISSSLISGVCSSGVPGIGLSMLIGIDTGSASRSLMASSMRCRRVSPMPMMPPEHILKPTSRAAAIVASLSSWVCVVQRWPKYDGAVSRLQW